MSEYLFNTILSTTPLLKHITITQISYLSSEGDTGTTIHVHYMLLTS